MLYNRILHILSEDLHDICQTLQHLIDSLLITENEDLYSKLNKAYDEYKNYELIISEEADRFCMNHNPQPALLCRTIFDINDLNFDVYRILIEDGNTSLTSDHERLLEKLKSMLAGLLSAYIYGDCMNK